MATVGMIYIGSYAPADTDETDWDNENDFVFAGTHDNNVLKAVTATVTTPLNDGVAYDDDNGQIASKITYNLGAGPVTATQDSVAAYNVTILLGDGSTVNTVVNVIQLTNGATFINESANGIQLDGKSIQSITLGTVFEENAIGWRTTRSIDGANIVCFAAGTLIATPNGERRVEALEIGDWVLTQDHGPQPLLWCAAQRSTGQGKAAPIVLQPGVLGPDRPKRPLRLSPQHRVLLQSDHAIPLAGGNEVLVAAKHLLGLGGINECPSAKAITYHHLMFARHEVIFADGAACESFFPGPMALDVLSETDRRALRCILRKANIRAEAYVFCRPVLRGRSLRNLLSDMGPITTTSTPGAMLDLAGLAPAQPC